MTVEVKTWEAPVITLDAVYLTNSNIEEVAKWMRASHITVVTDLTSKVRTVTFHEAYDGRSTMPGSSICRAKVGEYVVRKGAHISEYGETINDQYYNLSEEAVQTFREVTKE